MMAWERPRHSCKKSLHLRQPQGALHRPTQTVRALLDTRSKVCKA